MFGVEDLCFSRLGYRSQLPSCAKNSAYKWECSTVISRAWCHCLMHICASDVRAILSSWALEWSKLLPPPMHAHTHAQVARAEKKIIFRNVAHSSSDGGRTIIIKQRKKEKNIEPRRHPIKLTLTPVVVVHQCRHAPFELGFGFEESSICRNRLF